MKISEIELPVIHLRPSEIYISQGPAVVQTVLGSCVSVTMFERNSGTGIISHCLLPSCGGKQSCGRTCAEEHKYVDCSIFRMIERFDMLNVRRSNIEVKVFGGADMFTDFKTASVGIQNIEMALRTIRDEGLKVSTSDVGGTQGRKIFFYTHTGKVLLKRLGENIRALPTMQHDRKILINKSGPHGLY